MPYCRVRQWKQILVTRVPMGHVTFFRLSIWGFLIACLVLQGTEAATCPQSWSNYKKYCYLLREVRRRWNDAEADCQTYGAESHLASILSKEESKHIATAVREDRDPIFHIWIGLFRVKRGGRIVLWRWTDNAGVSYMPWGPGQPSNTNNKQFCVELYGADYMSWNDNDCEAKNYYICKMPAQNAICSHCKT